MNYTTIPVTKELYKRFQNQLGKKTDRVSPDDVDKDLELELCKLFLPWAKEIVPSEERHDRETDIDCFADSIAIQVKCRSKDHLYLEDKKIRHFNKIPGWVYRSKADLYLLVSPSSAGVLRGRIIGHRALLLVMEACQNKSNPELPNEKDIISILGTPNWRDLVTYKEDVMINDIGDSSGSFYEIALL